MLRRTKISLFSLSLVLMGTACQEFKSALLAPSLNSASFQNSLVSNQGSSQASDDTQIESLFNKTQALLDTIESQLKTGQKTASSTEVTAFADILKELGIIAEELNLTDKVSVANQPLRTHRAHFNELSKQFSEKTIHLDLLKKMVGSVFNQRIAFLKANEIKKDNSDKGEGTPSFSGSPEPFNQIMKDVFGGLGEDDDD